MKRPVPMVFAAALAAALAIGSFAVNVQAQEHGNNQEFDRGHFHGFVRAASF